MASDDKGVKRSHLSLTWLHRLLTKAEREEIAPGVVLTAASATVSDGVLHVLKIENTPPPGAPPNIRLPVAVRISHVAKGEQEVVHGEGMPPMGKGRPPTLAELDAVIHEFARRRVMALMMTGEGLAEGSTVYWELVEIAGAVMAEEPGPRMVH